MKNLKHMLLTAAALCVLLALALALPAWGANAEETEEIWSETVEAALLQEGRFDVEFSDPESEVGLLSSDSLETQLYDLIYTGLSKRAKSISLRSLSIKWSTANKTMLTSIYEKVINDHPRLIYCTGSLTFYYSSIFDRIEPDYNADYTAEKDAELDAAVNQALGQVSDTSSDLEKALALHDYLVLNCAYNWAVATETEKNMTTSNPVFSAYGALVNQDAVCQGYALAYELLLQEVGIQCVMATSDTMKHAWNMVKLDGAWYHVDTTWDDPTPNTEGQVFHTYFLISDETMQDSDHEHYGWTTYDGLTCDSDKYESGYVFSGVRYQGAYSSVYKWNGSYYYAKNYKLYRSSTLKGDGAEIKSASRTYSGFVWQAGDLYYAAGSNGTVQLKRYSLETGTDVALSGVSTYTQVASTEINEYGDPWYAASKDRVGLRLSEDGETIEAVSCVGRKVITTVTPYPSAWDSAALSSGETAKIAGWKIDNGKISVGVLWGGTDNTAVTVTAAFYDGSGKLVGMRSAAADMSRGRVSLARLDAGSLPEYKTVKVFVTDPASWAPVCAAWTETAA
jgi:hypothetical protein